MPGIFPGGNEILFGLISPLWPGGVTDGQMRRSRGQIKMFLEPAKYVFSIWNFHRMELHKIIFGTIRMLPPRERGLLSTMSLVGRGVRFMQYKFDFSRPTRTIFGERDVGLKFTACPTVAREVDGRQIPALRWDNIPLIMIHKR